MSKYSVPGWLRGTTRPAIGPVCGEPAGLDKREVRQNTCLCPVPGNVVLELSQPATAGLASAAVERRKASGLPIKPASAPRAHSGGDI
jgi:hypothetical protein